MFCLQHNHTYKLWIISSSAKCIVTYKIILYSRDISSSENMSSIIRITCVPHQSCIDPKRKQVSFYNSFI